jgi:hypothetical protein
VRWHDFSGAGKVLVASTTQTLTFTPSDAPGSVQGASVVAYHLSLGGRTGGAADADFGDISRIRLKANGVTIMDFGPGLALLALQSFLETFNWANTAPSAVGYQFTLPLWIPDARTEDEQDLCAFPVNAVPTIEVTIAASTGTGQQLFCGWTYSDVPPMFSPVLYGSQMNIAAGAVSARFPLVEPGLIRALGINIGGLGRFRAVLGGRQWANLASRPLTVAAAALHGSLFTEASSFRTPLTAGVSGGGTANNSGYHFFKLVGLPTAPSGSSFVEIDTNAGDWAGVANELTIYALRRSM